MHSTRLPCVRRSLAAALVAAALAAPSAAQELVFHAFLDEAQAVPATGSAARGTGAFVLDRAANTLDYRIHVVGLESAELEAGLHGFAPPGSSGPVLATLPLGARKYGAWHFAESDEADLVASLAYVSVRTAGFPAGEIRGQVVRDSTPHVFVCDVDGVQNVPPNNSATLGTGYWQLDTANDRLEFDVTMDPLSTFELGAHLHFSTGPGVNGPISVILGFGTHKHAAVTLDTIQRNVMLQDRFYLNIHSGQYGGGEVRGQLIEVATNPGLYCAGKTSSVGCVPTVSWCGLPTLTGADDFVVECSDVVNGKTGIFFWSTEPASAPFQGGTMCVAGPLRRTRHLHSGGNPPPDDCSGSYSFAFTQAFMAARGLAAGDLLYGQFWTRDPAHPDGTTLGLSDAIQFELRP